MIHSDYHAKRFAHAFEPQNDLCLINEETNKKNNVNFHV